MDAPLAWKGLDSCAFHSWTVCVALKDCKESRSNPGGTCFYGEAPKKLFCHDIFVRYVRQRYLWPTITYVNSLDLLCCSCYFILKNIFENIYNCCRSEMIRVNQRRQRINGRRVMEWKTKEVRRKLHWWRYHWIQRT